MADIKCPEGHSRIWAKGKVPSRTGLKQRYVCYTCGRTFYKPVETPKPRAKKSKSSKKKSG